MMKPCGPIVVEIEQELQPQFSCQAAAHFPYLAIRAGPMSAIFIWYWLNGSTFNRLRVEIIMIKYLAVAFSKVNFTS
jgi:hypothetical protein